MSAQTLKHLLSRQLVEILEAGAQEDSCEGNRLESGLVLAATCFRAVAMKIYDTLVTDFLVATDISKFALG